MNCVRPLDIVSSLKASNVQGRQLGSSQHVVNTQGGTWSNYLAAASYWEDC